MTQNSLPTCDMCRGKRYIATTGAMSIKYVACWLCDGAGVIDGKVSEEARVRISDVDRATVAAAERDKPKTPGEKLAFAMQHSNDGLCP